MSATSSNCLSTILARCQESGKTLATAESCTGGLVASMLSELPGSSATFIGGFVCYANSAKINLLGVSPALLADFGAVSAEVAAAMASGAKERLGSDYAVAITGIAGPSGGSATKPVGTVWLGLATPSSVVTKLLHLKGTRTEIRVLAAQQALAALLSLLS